MSLYVVPAVARHARMLGPHLREADATECLALTGLDPTEALLSSVRDSTEAFTAKIGNVPVGMFGHKDQGDGVGVFWLVGSTAMIADLRDFLSISSEWWSRITSRYDKCFNVVSEANTLHRRWLTWMGCSTSEPWQVGATLVRTFTTCVPLQGPPLPLPQ